MSEHTFSSGPHSYNLRSFPVTSPAGPALAKWMQAVGAGFLDREMSPEAIDTILACDARDGRVATGVYVDTVPAGALDAEYPVATYAAHRKTLNTGAAAPLPVHMITAVTVRTSHRRRGLLRAMITADLQQAKDDGLPMAALTASEATIYGRFGFAPATHHASVEVDAGPTFGFQVPAAAAHGTVELADPVVVQELEPVLFERIHAATFGSIGRQDAYRLSSSGYWSYAKPERDKSVRAALHYGPDGSADGYATYRFKGWDTTPHTVEVVDLLATTEEAYLALWNYLGSLDLVQRVVWHDAPLEDALEWALTHNRGYRRTRISDHLWLRILDTPAALAGRRYFSDAAVVLAVVDPLGHAGGTFRIEASGGSATVAELGPEAPADAEVGIAELSAMYLGGVSARTLAAAGRISELVPGAAARCDALFASPVRAHSLATF
ncbi:GNAT family N-acetyltransferase [Pseudarthrobacter sp. P1]|uniref:GNAT family N-acetyltransferase n=1 Tax=Pseudarthrobacter sp. P1 TaxID=3418418 RepID=UPI003CE9935F